MKSTKPKYYFDKIITITGITKNIKKLNYLRKKKKQKKKKRLKSCIISNNHKIDQISLQMVLFYC